MTNGFGFCPTCGTPRSAADQKFCAVCGSALAAAAPPAPPVATPVVPAPEPVVAIPTPAAPAVTPVTAPASSTPPAGEPAAQPAWAAPPAWPGAPAAQVAPQAAPSYPPAYPGAPEPAAPVAPAAPAAGFKVTPKLLLFGGVVLAAIVGAFVYLNMSSAAGGVTFSPSTISCAANVSVTMTIRLPASLHATDQVTVQVDGKIVSTISVGSQFIQQADSSWLYTGSGAMLGTCQGATGQVVGTHTVRVIDASSKVVAEGSVTVIP
jgi:hypothetical protein